MRLARPLGLTILSVLLFSTSVWAEMRYYVVPKVDSGGIQGIFPKYTDPGALGVGWNVGPWQAMDYGLENVFMLALNLTAQDHTTLTSQPDVLAVPSPIDANVSALALNTIQTKLEAGNIPADWVTTALTYRQCLSRVLRIITFMQRFRGTFGQLFAGGATLDTRINQLPVNARTALTQAAQSMGADVSTITGTTLIRAALVIVADQILPGGLPFGGDTF